MNKKSLTRELPAKQLEIEKLLVQLPTMTRIELQQLWKVVFGRNPNPVLRRDVMAPILAYRAQERAFGGLKNSTVRMLRELAQSNAGGNKPATRPKTGTRYIREYNGKLHEATVLDEGIGYEGVTYRSLTEIAKVITGTKWSGPAFFGLKKKVVTK